MGIYIILVDYRRDQFAFFLSSLGDDVFHHLECQVWDRRQVSTSHTGHSDAAPGSLL